MEKWIRSYIKDNSLNVDFKGMVPNEEAKALIVKCKAMFLPTRWYEGFPMTIVEAYSVGTPVICTNLGNAGSVVLEGKTGWKFNDADELIACTQKAEAADLYAEVRKHFEENYTAEVNYQKLMDVYDKCCNLLFA